MAKPDDDALQAALAQFNEGLKVQQSQQRAQRAIDKAERKKQQAATTLKKVQSDAGASGEDKAEAEAGYRAAVDEWTRLRSGEPEAPPEDAPDDSAPTDSAPTDDAVEKPEEPATEDSADAV